MRLPIFCILGSLAGFGLAKWDAARKTPRFENHCAPASAHSESAATDAPLSSQAARQRLDAALKGDGPFVCAQRMLDWINSVQAEEFAEFTKNPARIPMLPFLEFDQELKSAYYDALARRWFAVDPDGALRSIRSISDRLPKNSSNSAETEQAFLLLRGAARTQPKALIESMPAELQKDPDNVAMKEAFEAMGARDPNVARSFLDRFTNPAAREAAEISLVKGIARSDPLAAVAEGKRMKSSTVFQDALAAAERIGPGMVRQTAAAIGEDLAGIWGLEVFALRYPGILEGVAFPRGAQTISLFTQQLAEDADRLSPEERQAALDHLDEMPAGTKTAVAAALASSWARTEPRQAAEWAVARGKAVDHADPSNQAAQEVFLRWINNEPGEAVAWLRSLPESSLRDALGTNASTFLAEQGDIDTAMSLYRPQPGKNDDQVTAQLAETFAQHDPEKAAEWLRAVAPGVTVTSATQTVVDAWYGRDPAAVAQWVESLPAGARRDEAAQAFARQASADSPAGATAWVETIADPKLRGEAAAWVYDQMRNDDPSGAIQWIRSLQGTEPQWRERFLRMHQ